MKVKKIFALIVSLTMIIVLNTPVQAKANYRFLALGNSLTYYEPDNQIWFSKCGMAASTPDKDWVHQVTAALKKKHKQVTTDIRFITWERLPEKFASEQADIKALCENNPYDLITVENSDNINSASQTAQYETNLRSYISTIKQYNPKAKIVIINDFKSDFGFRDMTAADKCNEIIDRIAKEFNVKVADLSKIGGNKNYTAKIGATVYGDDGQAHTISAYNVANHPGDKGMKYIAYQVLKQIGIKLNVGHAFDDLKGDSTSVDGWHKIKGKTFYYLNEKKLKGLNDIDDSFYYFDKKTGVLKTGIVTLKNETYYTNDKGVVQLYKKGKTYYNHLNIQQDAAAGAELEATYLADYYNKKINKKKVKAKALKNAFNWIAKQKLSKKKLSTKTKGYAALMATSLFNKKGYAHASSYALAYLANAIGYKDSSVKTYKNNVFTVINKKVYAPELSKNNYGVKLNQFTKALKLGKLTSTKIPYSSTKKVKITGKATKLVAWDAKNKKLYYNNGSVATGVTVYKHKFYAFDKLGVYDAKLTKKLRAMTTYMHDAKDIINYMGYPLGYGSVPSCFSNGVDIIYVYKKFNITTFKSNDGKEIFISANEHHD